MANLVPNLDQLTTKAAENFLAEHCPNLAERLTEAFCAQQSYVYTIFDFSVDTHVERLLTKYLLNQGYASVYWKRKWKVSSVKVLPPVYVGVNKNILSVPERTTCSGVDSKTLMVIDLNFFKHDSVFDEDELPTIVGWNDSSEENDQYTDDLFELI